MVAERRDSERKEPVGEDLGVGFGRDDFREDVGDDFGTVLGFLVEELKLFLRDEDAACCCGTSFCSKLPNGELSGITGTSAPKPCFTCGKNRTKFLKKSPTIVCQT